MRKILACILVLGSCLFVCTGSALALFVDFNDAAYGEVIDTKYAPGLTLASIENVDHYLTELPVVVDADVIGTNSSGDYIAVSSDSSRGLLLTFADLMSSVSILGFDWGGSSNLDNESMYLSAFDQSGTFLGGNSFSGEFSNPNTRFGTLTFDNIAQVAFTFGNTTLGFYGIDYVDATEMGDTAPVPEPATLLLLGSGLAGLAFYRRRRN